MNSSTQNGSAAHALVGLELEGGWRVVSQAMRPPGATGGHFSVCYHVKNVDPASERHGERAFMKALDLAAMGTAPDLTQALATQTAAFNFERDLVDTCRQRRMSNVVEGRGSGEVHVPGFAPLLGRVNYLIFEAAEHDVRAALELSNELDTAWAFQTMHDVANGLRQLHQAGVFHQDLKPSNVLDFGAIRKVGDLGRASQDGVAAPHDRLPIPGDPSYAPPELLYGLEIPDERLRRKASDLYQLGSLMSFFFGKVSVTPGLMGNLDPDHRPPAFGGTYDDVLPMLLAAHLPLVQDLADAIPAHYRERCVATFCELSTPDVRQRGNPKATPLSLQRFQLDRYVSLFDNLAKSASTSVRRRLR